MPSLRTVEIIDSDKVRSNPSSPEVDIPCSVLHTTSHESVRSNDVLLGYHPGISPRGMRGSFASSPDAEITSRSAVATPAALKGTSPSGAYTSPIHALRSPFGEDTKEPWRPMSPTQSSSGLSGMHLNSSSAGHLPSLLGRFQQTGFGQPVGTLARNNASFSAKTVTPSLRVATAALDIGSEEGFSTVLHDDTAAWQKPTKLLRQPIFGWSEEGCEALNRANGPESNGRSILGLAPDATPPKKRPAYRIIPANVSKRPICRNVNIVVFYALEKLVATGAFGQVFKARERSTGILFAAKKINKLHATRSGINWAKEMHISEQMNHPHITRVHQIFDDTASLHIVMDLCVGGDLFNYVTAQAKKGCSPDGRLFTESQMADWLRQMISSLDHVHSQGIAHRDIKPENFLFTLDPENDASTTRLKLIDFGLAIQNADTRRSVSVASQRDLNDASIDQSSRNQLSYPGRDAQSTHSQGYPTNSLDRSESDSVWIRRSSRIRNSNSVSCAGGSPHYMAPEVLAPCNYGYNEMCDMWSIGIIFFFLLTGGNTPTNIIGGNDAGWDYELVTKISDNLHRFFTVIPEDDARERCEDPDVQTLFDMSYEADPIVSNDANGKPTTRDSGQASPPTTASASDPQVSAQEATILLGLSPQAMEAPKPFQAPVHTKRRDGTFMWMDKSFKPVPISSKAFCLLSKLLKRDPKQRISAREALAHAWLVRHCASPIEYCDEILIQRVLTSNSNRSGAAISMNSSRLSLLNLCTPPSGKVSGFSQVGSGLSHKSLLCAQAASSTTTLIEPERSGGADFYLDTSQTACGAPVFGSSSPSSSMEIKSKIVSEDWSLPPGVTVCAVASEDKTDEINMNMISLRLPITHLSADETPESTIASHVKNLLVIITDELAPMWAEGWLRLDPLQRAVRCLLARCLLDYSSIHDQDRVMLRWLAVFRALDVSGMGNITPEGLATALRTYVNGAKIYSALQVDFAAKLRSTFSSNMMTTPGSPECESGTPFVPRPPLLDGHSMGDVAESMHKASSEAALFQTWGRSIPAPHEPPTDSVDGTNTECRSIISEETAYTSRRSSSSLSILEMCSSRYSQESVESWDFAESKSKRNTHSTSKRTSSLNKSGLNRVGESKGISQGLKARPTFICSLSKQASKESLSEKWAADDCHCLTTQSHRLLGLIRQTDYNSEECGKVGTLQEDPLEEWNDDTETGIQKMLDLLTYIDVEANNVIEPHVFLASVLDDSYFTNPNLAIQLYDQLRAGAEMTLDVLKTNLDWNSQNAKCILEHGVGEFFPDRLGASAGVGRNFAQDIKRLLRRHKLGMTDHGSSSDESLITSEAFTSLIRSCRYFKTEEPEDTSLVDQMIQRI